MRANQTISKHRVADHGEVFTALREVNAMLDLVKPETERIDSRFLEPACGDGNFLVEILRRKLAVVKSRYRKNSDDYERYAVIAVSSVYGVELLPDNAHKCRERLFKIFDSEYTENCRKTANDETREAVRYILRQNIICGDTLTMKDQRGNPIIFSEWAAINGYLIKRRDYVFKELVEQESGDQMINNDIGQTAFIPKEILNFPPIHYRKVQQYERKANQIIQHR